MQLLDRHEDRPPYRGALSAPIFQEQEEVSLPDGVQRRFVAVAIMTTLSTGPLERRCTRHFAMIERCQKPIP